MSKYITAVIPCNIAVEQINNIAIINNLIFTPINNRFIKKQLMNNNLQYYWVEWINNKYDTAIGNSNKIVPSIEEIINSLSFIPEILDGLSENFIKEMKEEELEEQHIAKESLENWTRFLRTFLSESPQNEIGLILHCYQGLVENEKAEISKIIKINITNLEQLYMPNNMQEDVLYLFSYSSIDTLSKEYNK